MEPTEYKKVERNKEKSDWFLPTCNSRPDRGVEEPEGDPSVLGDDPRHVDWRPASLEGTTVWSDLVETDEIDEDEGGEEHVDKTDDHVESSGLGVGPGLLGGSAVVFERNVILEIERHHEYYGCHPGQERAVEVSETRQQLLINISCGGLDSLSR